MDEHVNVLAGLGSGQSSSWWMYAERMLMKGGEKCSSGGRRIILVSWWSGKAEYKCLPAEWMARLPLRRNVRSIGKVDRAGVGGVSS